MAQTRTEIQARYDAKNCRTYGLKLNHGTDKDIIEKLASVPNIQGYIKQLIRADIAASAPNSEPDSAPEFVTVFEGYNPDGIRIRFDLDTGSGFLYEVESGSETGELIRWNDERYDTDFNFRFMLISEGYRAL